MRTVVVVVVLPLAKLLVEQVDVVGDSVLVEELIELPGLERTRHESTACPDQPGQKKQLNEREVEELWQQFTGRDASSPK